MRSQGLPAENSVVPQCLAQKTLSPKWGYAPARNLCDPRMREVRATEIRGQAAAACAEGHREI